MEEQFICKECNKKFDISENLGKHVKYHMSRENYYIKWIKKDNNEGICKVCGEETRFLGVLSGYSK